MIKKREAKELKIINMRNERYGITRDSSDVKIIIILYFIISTGIPSEWGYSGYVAGHLSTRE